MVLYDAQLGWKLKPHWSGQHKHYDYQVRYALNQNGFRGQPLLNSNNNYTVVGDSFSFGLGVNDNETFTARLNAAETNSTSLNYTGKKFYNLSVPGYSTDQQLLLLKKLSHKISKHVLLVVYLGNDLFDNMRAYPLQADHGKPYYKFSDNALELKNTPVPLEPKPAAVREESIAAIVSGGKKQNNYALNSLAKLEISRRLGLFQGGSVLTKEAMQQRFDESLKLFLTLLIEIDAVVNKNQGNVTVVLLPGRSYVEQPSSLSAQYQEYFRDYISASLKGSGSIRLMDLASHLKNLHNTGVDKLYYPNEGHLTALGHQYVADYLADQIKYTAKQ